MITAVQQAPFMRVRAKKVLRTYISRAFGIMWAHLTDHQYLEFDSHGVPNRSGLVPQPGNASK